uniref:Uncharacterized protein n=2 Tax=Phytophthora fragariae TaxID=53985 RepID=A0A6A3DPI4_9STRA|nr:hypothetical protein PF009_g28078 [Phytophthora fragariae]
MEELFSPAAPEPEPSMIPVEHKLTEFPEWVQIREGVRSVPSTNARCVRFGSKSLASGERRDFSARHAAMETSAFTFATEFAPRTTPATP